MRKTSELNNKVINSSILFELALGLYPLRNFSKRRVPLELILAFTVLISSQLFCLHFRKKHGCYENRCHSPDWSFYIGSGTDRNIR